MVFYSTNDPPKRIFLEKNTNLSTLLFFTYRTQLENLQRYRKYAPSKFTVQILSGILVYFKNNKKKQYPVMRIENIFQVFEKEISDGFTLF